MKIKVGDKVKVIAGSSKGKEGKVLQTFRSEDRVIVEGVNIIKKHKKGNGQDNAGGIIEMAGPIHVSNVKLLEGASKEKKTTKKEPVKKEEKKTDKKVAEKKEAKEKPAAKKETTKKSATKKTESKEKKAK